MTKKGWNGYNFWPICHRQLTDIPPTINRQRIGQVSAAILTNISGESRSICWPWLSRHLGWYVGRYVGRYVDWHISAVISSRVGQYVDRRIGWVLVDMSTDTSVECQLIGGPIYWSRDAQNTHDPMIIHCWLLISQLLIWFIAYCDELVSKIIQICSMNDYHYVTSFEW